MTNVDLPVKAGKTRLIGLFTENECASINRGDVATRYTVAPPSFNTLLVRIMTGFTTRRIELAVAVGIHINGISGKAWHFPWRILR